MDKKCFILGVGFNTLTNEETVTSLLSFLEGEEKHMVFTPNPEMVMEALKDNELFEILNSAALVLPDGAGIVWASRFSDNKITERVAGCDVIQNLFGRLDKEHTVYFFGAAPGIADKAKERMSEKYKNLKIIGASDGYFDEEREKIIIDEINNLRPDILLVGLGVPKQEKWIYKNIDRLNVKVLIGVGGSFDILSGNLKRAPKALRSMGLEWFYRLLQEPGRFVRMLRLPLFVLKVLKEYRSGR